MSTTTDTATITTACVACEQARTARDLYLAYGALVVGPLAARPGSSTHNAYRTAAADYFNRLGADNAVIGCTCA